MDEKNKEEEKEEKEKEKTTPLLIIKDTKFEEIDKIDIIAYCT